jgi:ATP-dependent DNA helicase DinG
LSSNFVVVPGGPLLPDKSINRPAPADDIDLWLGPESPLARELPGFQPRPGQVDMARAVSRAFRREVPLIVEAGTGTGKTLAYLVPALLSGLKVVVSTGTRTLQDQINHKELPLLARAMAPDLRWAVLKGRTNYLCRRRYEAFANQPDLNLPGAEGGLLLLRRWARGTKNGDLDQVRGQGLSTALSAEITSSSEQCLGGRCPRREECFLMEARRKAAEADIVVVNHHLFLADLMLKAGGHGEALPRYQAVVFDEAHLVAEVATQVFGVNVSQARVNTLLRDLAREAPGKDERKQAANAVDAAAVKLFSKLRRMTGPVASLGLEPGHLEMLAKPGAELASALEKLAGTLHGDEVEESLATRAVSLADDLSAVAQPVPGHTVAWVQTARRGISLNLSPVEVGPHLETALYQDISRLVFTSATLAATGDLEPTRIRLGLDTDTVKLIVASPFDPATQSLLYVPKSMPAPNHNDFAQAVAGEVEELLGLSGGRAFVLFTTHRNLQTVSGLLREKLPYTCLVQGEAPRMKLLTRFKEETPSVLFATASFWQGVDVPGEELSAVIVDKLPFAPPDDPLVAARIQRIEEEGKSGFAHLMLPEAVLSLKQGLGRLLRTPEDRGLLAVLDTRLATKGYGKVFQKALKPTPLTRSKEDVAAFFDEKPMPF